MSGHRRAGEVVKGAVNTASQEEEREGSLMRKPTAEIWMGGGGVGGVSGE